MFSENLWAILPILVAINTGVAGFINQKCNIQNGDMKQAISWLCGLAIGVIVYLSGIIETSSPALLPVIILSILIGLTSNGLYDIEDIKNLIKKI